VVYSKIENCHTADQIAHPAVREVLRYLKIDRGVEIHHDGDLPARSGMGSSSAFTVGLLHALYALKGQIVDNHRLASESIYLEQAVMRETVGSQDQVAAAYGGLNHVRFSPNGEITVKPLTLTNDKIEELNSHLMLFYSGIKRTASEVAESYVNDIEAKEKQLAEMKDFVDEGISILNSNQDIIAFGKLLHKSWLLKRALSSEVSNSYVDELYNSALKAGAVGGKLTGAGGGGFILLFVPPSQQAKLRKKFDHLIYVPFKFEFSGTQIIFFDPQEDFSTLESARAIQNIKPFRERKR
jgi:D-glycero-alpha-D-manno-heptose-7-phosphate kinase